MRGRRSPTRFLMRPQPVTGPILVGSYYFPGHFNAARWVPMVQARFPFPLLGYYRDGEPVVSDWHIKWALEHGISFFAFDWYYDYRTGVVAPAQQCAGAGFPAGEVPEHDEVRDLLVQ